ncbi:cation diffusion facilitator family transporter [Allosaccharopolyspora coralli]|uniref:cation diffusion facilitator family transporter n=1 Tax=Allosaccharopolyspora coralli TaxID=2665642 RepID=UPI001E5806D1|nr:cation diffusion facilitator family transporter [Allosaccharopolyspora coralli]
MDDALTASGHGIRAVRVSLAGLGATALLQLVVVMFSGSVALLADTIHNFSDALTSVPLWIAFVLGRRAPTRSFTYGFGRAEDLAGLFIVAMIALSAVLAGYQSISRLIDPQPLDNVGWVLAAGLIGFAGNELVAVYRIRVGRRIGSAALVADGLHARTDGFTSLAVVLGALGVLLGFPLADPIVGLLITVAIVVLLAGTIRDVGTRLLDGVDPDLVRRAESVVAEAAPTTLPPRVALRWSGHRLHISIELPADETVTIGAFHQQAHAVEHALRATLPSAGPVTISPLRRGG